jgi:hypothetical protein
MLCICFLGNAERAVHLTLEELFSCLASSQTVLDESSWHKTLKLLKLVESLTELPP